VPGEVVLACDAPWEGRQCVARLRPLALGILQLPGRERELSVYASEAGYDFGPARLRRFIDRLDGFVAASGDAEGELLTRPLRFAGRSLELNARTRAGGREPSGNARRW
jgi:hypothetical protein